MAIALPEHALLIIVPLAMIAFLPFVLTSWLMAFTGLKPLSEQELS